MQNPLKLSQLSGADPDVGVHIRHTRGVGWHHPREQNAFPVYLTPLSRLNLFFFFGFFFVLLVKPLYIIFQGGGGRTP